MAPYVDLYGELRGPRGRQDSRVFPLRKNMTNLRQSQRAIMLREKVNKTRSAKCLRIWIVFPRSPRRPTCPTSSVNYAASMGAHLKLTTQVSGNTSECNKVPPRRYSNEKVVPAFWEEIRLQ